MAEDEKIEVNGRTIYVRRVPLAASTDQFLLLNEIGEVLTVGFRDFEGKITYKFGEPLEEAKPVIEEALARILGEFE